MSQQTSDHHPQPQAFANGVRINPATPAVAAAAATVTPVAQCRPPVRQPTDPVNPDEAAFPDFKGNFHKGLSHAANGLVVAADYQTLVRTLHSHRRNPAEFDTLPLALGRKLTNPQAGKAIDVEGPDPRRMAFRPAPTVESAETAVEAIELYWMALARDIPFTQWGSHPQIAQAAAELTSLQADFYGPTVGGAVTTGTVFRGCTPGDNAGPFLSQFLWRDIPYGSLLISQQQRTAVPNQDYLTTQTDWLAAQNGAQINPQAAYDPTRRYIRSLRDLAEYVHVDALYEAYLNACLILLGANAPLNPGNPYSTSTTQIGFGTWGGPHVLSLVCEVATRALKCVWWQKWFMHRRLRPEAFAGLVEHNLLPASNPVFASAALAASRAKFAGSSLMPMAFPEGSPTHPAYGAGHATVAGACVTVLKAFFDENAIVSGLVQASDDGLSLLPVPGTLTVGGELSKLAANIAIGRNGGGVHWRSDYSDSVELGERIAIYMLRHQAADYHEDWSAQFTKFDGTPVTLQASEELDL